MMSPRSFLLAHRQGQRIAPAPAHSAAPATHIHNTCSTNNTSSPTPYPSPSPSTLPPSSTTPYPTDRNSTNLPPYTATTTTTTLPTFSPLRWSPKYDEGKIDFAVNITPIPVPIPNANMGKRKDRRETLCLSPSSPPTTTTSLTTRPTTPTSPVKIPTTNGNRPVAHPQKRHSSQRRRPRDSFSPECISPSLVALLAVTDIPRPRQLQRRRRRTAKSMTVDEVMDCQHGSEKDLGWSLSRSPLDMLLSPPQDAMDDDDSVSDCNLGSAMSTRTYSMDSIPSLDESFTSDGLSSFDTPRTPSPLSRRSRSSPMRKSLEPILSPPGSVDEHPLASGKFEDEEFDFNIPSTQPEETATKSQFLQPFKPLRSVFKSNLTASLRALKSAAKSFSAINFPSIPSDDFLTRSILTIDPNVPYTDERRPPVLEEIPSEALRRYLNPTTNARIESPSKTFRTGTFAASIQMRTYKIQRNRSTPPSSRNPYPSTSLQTSPAPQQPQPQAPTHTAPAFPPGMRQREMRENPDFIRIAVMEMAMRKRGKLDDQRPGRARWALPPRKMTSKPYEVASDGVPVRWIPISS
ncbi:hypothetical protein EDB81DRAFT_61718 [Dactylonectria macrodidyma]|uniref:Uncharacterized protein n=1 Tax=Dactylonectria macrodidyma TaxID=307937 RepID=A0A9P9J3G2_9HYPO|nr:hypothetical protein EDB81DRAFT_61718 [Dactylonectria macrodidyma]